MIDLKNIKPEYKAGAIALALVALLLFVAFFFDFCGRRTDQRELQNINGNISNLNNQAQNTNLEINNLKLQGAEINGRLNEERNDLNTSRKETDNAKTEVHNSLTNINSINNANYSNTGLNKALRARCRAFPDAPECRR